MSVEVGPLAFATA